MSAAIARKMAQAAAATDAVQALVGQALERLDGDFNGRIVDGFGIYSEPGRRRETLRLSIDALNAALARMTDTAWPSPADYDAAESAGP